jgi:hypothetical protein
MAAAIRTEDGNFNRAVEREHQDMELLPREHCKAGSAV